MKKLMKQIVCNHLVVTGPLLYFLDFMLFTLVGNNNKKIKKIKNKIAHFSFTHRKLSDTISL